MHKLTVLYRKPPNPEQFRSHYESIHIPLIAKMPGVLRFDYSFDVMDPMGNPSAYFCVFEAYFATAQAMNDATMTPEGQAVLADVANCGPGEFDMINFAIPDKG